MNKSLNLGLLGLGFCGLLYANPYLVEPDKRVNAAIALNQLNRIKVVEDRITQVFGEDNTFSLETDTENGQIFVKPHHEKPLFFTIVTENGESIDLSLTPSEIEAQTIVLKTAPTPQKNYQEKGLSFTNLMVDLITAMSKGAEINGFPRFKESKNEFFDSLTVELLEVYQSHTVRGEHWRIKNTGNTTQTLTEKQFLTEPNIAAIALKTHTLAPNDSTQLFKVKNDE